MWIRDQNERRTPGHSALPGWFPKQIFRTAPSEPHFPICKVVQAIPAQSVVRSIQDEVWENGKAASECGGCLVHSSICIEWLLCPRYWVGPWDTVMVNRALIRTELTVCKAGGSWESVHSRLSPWFSAVQLHHLITWLTVLS